MLTGDIRKQMDRIWDAFWSGGIANPVDVIEQITYLLFLKSLHEIQVLEEKKANRLGKPMERRIFPEGNDLKGMPYEEFRWTRLKNASPHEMYVRLADHIFPFLRGLGAESTYAQYMSEARFTIPESLIARAVDLIDSVPVDDRETKGDVYEYMLGKLATSGTNGPFRTPRHIIRHMVEMTAPKPNANIGMRTFAAGDETRVTSTQAKNGRAVALGSETKRQRCIRILETSFMRQRSHGDPTS